MSIILNTKKRLLSIKMEFIDFKNFTNSTIDIVESRAQEVKALVVNVLGKDEEIFQELEDVKIISQNYKEENRGLEVFTIKKAIRHLENAIDLFFQKIK